MKKNEINQQGSDKHKIEFINGNKLRRSLLLRLGNLLNKVLIVNIKLLITSINNTHNNNLQVNYYASIIQLNQFKINMNSRTGVLKY